MMGDSLDDIRELIEVVFAHPQAVARYVGEKREKRVKEYEYMLAYFEAIVKAVRADEDNAVTYESINKHAAPSTPKIGLDGLQWFTSDICPILKPKAGIQENGELVEEISLSLAHEVARQDELEHNGRLLNCENVVLWLEATPKFLTMLEKEVEND